MGQNAGVFCRKSALAPFGKEFFEQGGGFVGGDAGIYFWFMVQGRLFKQTGAMRHRAALGIVRAIIKPRDAGMGNRPGTHGAGFQRDPQIASGQAVIAQKRCCLSNGYDFGMCGWVVAFHRAIGTAPDNDPVLDDDRANGHFAVHSRRPRKIERFIHHFAGFGQGHAILLAQIPAFGHTSA